MNQSIRVLPCMLLFTQFLFTQQVITSHIDQNQVNAAVGNDGTFFINRQYDQYNQYKHGYEVPQGSGNHTVFCSSFWFSGVDKTDTFRLAAELYGQRRDLSTGPYSSLGDYNTIEYSEKYFKSSWTVSKEEIIFHIDNYAQPGYKIPESIKNWPGNGDTTLGVAHQLAPFVDVDNDGIYNPEKGDYPCIKGDMANLVILNDAHHPHLQSGGLPLDIEIHFMVYQFNSDDFIDTTTFMNVTVYNRGQHHFEEFKLSHFVDFDIGFPDDDYIGYDTLNNMMIGYNATSFDPGYGGMPGYGDKPPAFGVVPLSHKMFNGGTLKSAVIWPPIIPSPYSIPVHFENTINSRWFDGQPWTMWIAGYMSSDEPTNFLFPGDPYTGEGWSELNAVEDEEIAIDLGDRRAIFTLESTPLPPEESVSYDFAYLFSGNRGHLENIVDLKKLAEAIHPYYEDNIKNNSCETSGTGVVAEFPKPDPFINRFFMDVTRFDGQGNSFMFTELTKETEQAVLKYNFTDTIHYKRGNTPIEVEYSDTVDYVRGYYILKATENIKDTMLWAILRYDSLGGSLLDSIAFDIVVSSNEKIDFEEWGFSIHLQHLKYPCKNNSLNCQLRNRIAIPIQPSIQFENASKKWLTGVKHTFNFSPMNWITSGSNTSESTFPDEANSPYCYPDLSGFDNELKFSNLLDGIVSPAQFTRFMRCSQTPIGIPNINGINHDFYAAINAGAQTTIFHPNVDIVFTSDKSKWTRCPVIELSDSAHLAANNGMSGLLRRSPSIDKNGRQAGDDGFNAEEGNLVSSEGMGWFPGYAINVETGRRLNMAYCENSSLSDENSTDMIWNPTSRIQDENGDFVLGGQHTIYVFGGEFDDMPIYDDGRFIHDSLAQESTFGYRAVYRNLSWVMQPILQQGHELLETDVRISLRVNKELGNKEITGLNEGRPMFGWKVRRFNPVLDPLDFLDNTITLFPNPTNHEVTISWVNPAVKEIQFFNAYGQLIKTVYPDPYKYNQVTTSVQELAGGVYYIRAERGSAKLVVLN